MWGGVGVALDEVDHAENGVDGGVGDDAVAEVEDVAGTAGGELRIDFRDGAVTIGPGEMFVVPKGVEHKPFAEREVKLMLIEPKGLVNTGDAGGEMTAKNDVWL